MRYTGECTCRPFCGQPGYWSPTFAFEMHLREMRETLGASGIEYTIDKLLEIAHIALERGGESAESRLGRIREVVHVPESEESSGDMSGATESTRVPEETDEIAARTCEHDYVREYPSGLRDNGEYTEVCRHCGHTR